MDRNIKTEEYLEEPWTKPWPPDGLESVKACPVCDESDREILHSDLVDNSFRVAPGAWSLWKCGNCGSAYLDPRPTTDTINLAYQNYYTHQDEAERDDYASLSTFGKLRRRLSNGYINWRFSARTEPSSALGVLAAFVLPSLRSGLDLKYRHLPRAAKEAGRLLDVGCGNGSFLRAAESLGWKATGIDPDPKAVANGRGQGLNVLHGGLEQFDGKESVFDVITLNHVIEHVHDPVASLKDCLRLLVPGGQLWLETPNIDSFGHARFQRNWRGLETPRHLVLFNRRSLSQAFINAGYFAPHDRTRPSICASMFKSSYAIVQGHSPYKAGTLPKALQWQSSKAAFLSALMPSRREFLTVTARKAG